ncbi:hypothetical protein BaRGS_00039789 [Batillaria attramentaria]|uniref:Secreted protein n=1 Tax=Batillaria attramentaria TaxID=370345 RepID=A0ABD0J230_9CAEN
MSRPARSWVHWTRVGGLLFFSVFCWHIDCSVLKLDSTTRIRSFIGVIVMENPGETWDEWPSYGPGGALRRRRSQDLLKMNNTTEKNSKSSHPVGFVFSVGSFETVER